MGAKINGENYEEKHLYNLKVNIFIILIKYIFIIY